jgi:hypothetical protein
MLVERRETHKPLLGRFWLAGRDENSSRPGIITLTPAGASIQLEGSLSESPILQNVVLFGKLLPDDELVSLFNCFGSVRSRNGAPTDSEIESTLAIFGLLTTDLKSNGIEFRLPGSETWFHEQTFKVAFDELGRDHITVTFQKNEEQHYQISESLTLTRMYRSSFPIGNWGTEHFKATRALVYQFRTKIAADYDELMSFLVRFRRLLTFLSHVPFQQADIFLLAQGPSSFPVHQSSLFPISIKKLEWDDQLIPYDEIKDRFEMIIAQWFKLYKEAPEPFERFFSALERGHSDTIRYFLWMIAAVEEVHKVKTKRKKAVLLERLRDLCSRWSKAMEHPPSAEVLDKMVKSRNYFAHAAGDLRMAAARDWHLLRYSFFLAAIFCLEVLELLGWADDDAISIARSRYWIRESLALRAFPDES